MHISFVNYIFFTLFYIVYQTITYIHFNMDMKLVYNLYV